MKSRKIEIKVKKSSYLVAIHLRHWTFTLFIYLSLYLALNSGFGFLVNRIKLDIFQ
jgi:hypothetical protein